MFHFQSIARALSSINLAPRQILMKRHWVCLQPRFEAPKDFYLAMASCRAAFSGNASLIILSPFLVVK